MASAKTKKNENVAVEKSEKSHFLKRLMKTNSTRDAIFLFTAVYIILPIGLIFIAISYNIYRERSVFVEQHPEVS